MLRMIRLIRVFFASSADSTTPITICRGTSMAVYPAAGLIHYVPRSARCYVVDPKEVPVSRQVTFIKDVATRGVTQLVNNLMQ